MANIYSSQHTLKVDAIFCQPILQIRKSRLHCLPGFKPRPAGSRSCLFNHSCSPNLRLSNYDVVRLTKMAVLQNALKIQPTFPRSPFCIDDFHHNNPIFRQVKWTHSTEVQLYHPGPDATHCSLNSWTTYHHIFLSLIKQVHTSGDPNPRTTDRDRSMAC